MTIAETRIDLVSFKCDGCDCGACVADSMRAIHQIPGVDHVRTDRRRTQIVVRHDADGVRPTELREVFRARGIELSS
jgi:copper chaperone CopZ